MKERKLSGGDLVKRNIISLFIVAIAALVFIPSPRQAAAENVFVSGGIGTLGFGASLGYRINEKFKARLNANYLGLDRSDTVDNINYDADFKNFTLGLIGDWHPFAGGFRVSGGLYYIDLGVDIDARLTPGRAVEIGDNRYDPAELGKVSGSVDWNKFAPYLGIGWESGDIIAPGWNFFADLGTLYISGADVDYHVSNRAAFTAHPDLRNDIERERREVVREIDNYHFYPVLSLGAGYRF
jgi:hypothetical protein